MKYEEIQKMVEDTKKKFVSIEDRIPEIQNKIYEFSGKWRDAVVNSEPDETLREFEGEITRLEKQLELLQGLDPKKESLDFMKRDKKLVATCKDFETKQLKVLDGMMAEEEKLAEAVKQSFDGLIENIKAMREKRQEMANTGTQIDNIRQYIENPVPIPCGSYYEEYRVKMTRFNIVDMSNKLRMAAGHFPATD